MRRKTVVILALVLVFALMFTACAVRRPLQTPVQPRQDTTGQYNNNRGTGSGTGTNTGMGTGTNTGVGTRTGAGTNTYTGYGPSANDPYDLGYGAGNNAGYGGYDGYGGYSGYSGYNTGNNGGFGGYGDYYNGMNGGYGIDYRNMGGSNNSPNYGLNNTGGTTQADRLEKSVEQMTGVDDATVVVSGNTAYVGIDTDGDVSGKKFSYGNSTGVAALKQACAQKVRASNPQIQTVYVSTDANFGERLRRVGDGVRTGSPVNGFRNELNELVRRLTPERQ